jgi:predicted dinucleotide-binding enzyme
MGMNISIIGAGNVGATLTRLLTAAGHRVSVANSRGPQTLSALAAETGAQARTVAEAGRGADVVIVAVPFGAVPDIARDALTDLPEGTVVVDSGNYVPGLRDAAVPELDGGVESVWTAARIGRPVVKAFNTVTADHLARLGRPAGAAGRIALPVAGDDPAGTTRVRELVGDAGFDAVDAGPLAESWRQQPGTPVYTADLDAAGVREALRHAKPEQTRRWRARMIEAAARSAR